MSQPPVKINVLAAAALVFLALPARASDGLSGRFRGDLGVIRFDTSAETGEVTGAFESGGKCDYLPGQAVVDGAMEGNVFVGRVFLCQTGTACQNKFYPLLAFVSPDDGAFSAMVKLDTGCSSPVVGDRKLLTLQKVEGADLASGTGTSATQLVRGKLDRRQLEKNQQVARSAFKRAADAIDEKPHPDLVTARDKAREAVSLDPRYWEAYLLLGVAEFKLGNPHAAIVAYQRSAELEPANATTHYDLACAYARLKEKDLALAKLRIAVERGFNDPDIARDNDLNGLFGNDPDFKELVDQVAKNAQKPASPLKRHR